MAAIKVTNKIAGRRFDPNGIDGKYGPAHSKQFKHIKKQTVYKQMDKQEIKLQK